MSDLHAAIEHFENSPALRREFAYTLQAMKDARDALEQAQETNDFQASTITDLMESLDEAKYDEPELRAKLDKQRQQIKQLKKEIDDFSDYRALKREQIARLQSQLADVASYESAALRKRIEQLEAALIESDNGQIRCLACKRQTYAGQTILHKSDCPLPAGNSGS